MLDLSENTHEATVLAFSNQKGGVGKTTSCLTMAASLADRGYRVLLIDCDSQAHLSVSLGFDAKDHEVSHADIYLGNVTAVDAVYQTTVEGLDIIPAEMDLALVERTMATNINYEVSLRTAIAELRARYDFMLCDCSPSVGALTINALCAANWVLIPSQCEYLAAHGVIQLLRIIDSIRQRVNPTLRHRLMVSMFDTRNSISHRILGQMKAAFGDRLFETQIQIDCRIKESQAAGMVVTQYAPRTRAAYQFQALCDEFLRVCFEEGYQRKKDAILAGPPVSGPQTTPPILSGEALP